MKNKNKLIIIVCIILLIVSLVIGVSTGYIGISIVDFFKGFINGSIDEKDLLILGFRLPRIFLSMLVGMGLSLSGCILQNVSKNDLADPGILGINSGASLMVIVYILLFNSNSFMSVFTMPFLALVGGGLAALLIYALSYRKHRGIETIQLVLTGVAVQAGITALITVLTVKLDETQYDFVATWLAGSISGSNWNYVLTLLPWILILIPYVFKKAKVMDLLSLNNETSYSLGVEVEKEQKKLLIAAVALAASCVAVSGNISFVGLLSPHLSKKLVGIRYKVLLPTSMFVGALLVSIADTIGRTVIQPAEIQVGIIIAIIGAPYFIYLLVSKR